MVLKVGRNQSGTTDPAPFPRQSRVGKVQYGVDPLDFDLEGPGVGGMFQNKFTPKIRLNGSMRLFFATYVELN